MSETKALDAFLARHEDVYSVPTADELRAVRAEIEALKRRVGLAEERARAMQHVLRLYDCAMDSSEQGEELENARLAGERFLEDAS